MDTKRRPMSFMPRFAAYLVGTVLFAPLNGHAVDPFRFDPEQPCSENRACSTHARVLVAASRIEKPETKQVFLVIEHKKRRVVGHNARKGTYRELQLSGYERIVRSGEAKQILVVATNRRYLAYSAHFSPWHVANIVPNERLLDMRVEDTVAIVLTTQRVLTFDARRGRWAIRDRN